MVAGTTIATAVIDSPHLLHRPFSTFRLPHFLPLGVSQIQISPAPSGLFNLKLLLFWSPCSLRDGFGVGDVGAEAPVNQLAI